jgi:hypothetical protein
MTNILRLTLLLFVSVTAYCEERRYPPFCEQNPTARICQSARDVAQDEREDLAEQCRMRPNTERCKNKATAEKVKKERFKFCEENPKACAAKRLR